MRRGLWDNQVLEEIKIDKTYRVNSEVGVDINIRLELTSRLESRSKSSGD